MAKRQLHKLSARQAETITQPGQHSDGGGLYLAIETGAHGRRQWVFMYRVRGTNKRREIGLGSAKAKGKDGLSLADARLRAADARKALAEGKGARDGCLPILLIVSSFLYNHKCLCACNEFGSNG